MNHVQTVEQVIADNGARQLQAQRGGNSVAISDNVLSVIARAAADPNVDIDKLERLLQMQERVMDRNAKAEFTAALAKMQPLLPVVGERGGITDRTGKIQSTYALWEDINDAIKPILTEHGFALSFKTRQEGERIVTTGILSHVGGHCEQTELGLPVDISGNKNAVQAVGSSTSYGKRYTALALLNITSRGEDDDGAKADVKRAQDDSPPLSAKQRDLIQNLAPKAGKTVEGICKAYRVDALVELTEKQGNAIIQRLQSDGAK